MVKRVNGFSCYDCIHLQRENPIISGAMAHYRCSSQERNGKCVGWVEAEHPDRGLKTQGGSCCNRIYPGDKVEIKSYFSNNSVRYLYCGKVGNKYLLHRPSNMGNIEVEKEFFRGQTGNLSNRIRCIKQNPEQLEASKRMAKKRKKKYVEAIENNTM